MFVRLTDHHHIIKIKCLYHRIRFGQTQICRVDNLAEDVISRRMVLRENAGLPYGIRTRLESKGAFPKLNVLLTIATSPHTDTITNRPMIP